MKEQLAPTAIRNEAPAPTVACPLRGHGVNQEDCWSCGHRLIGARCDVSGGQSPDVYRDIARMDIGWSI